MARTERHKPLSRDQKMLFDLDKTVDLRNSQLVDEPENEVRETEVNQFIENNTVLLAEPARGKARPIIIANPLTGGLYIRTEQTRPTDPEHKRLRRWSYYPNIDSALRSMNHALEGIQTDRTEMHGLFAVAKFGLATLRNSEITPETVGEISRRTQESLQEIGAVDLEKSQELRGRTIPKIRYRKPIRVNATLQTMLSQDTDRLGRINDLVARSEAAAAIIRSYQEIIFTRYATRSFLSRYGFLEGERALMNEKVLMTLNWIETALSKLDKEVLFPATIHALSEFAGVELINGEVRYEPYRSAFFMAQTVLGFIDLNTYENRFFLEKNIQWRQAKFNQGRKITSVPRTNGNQKAQAHEIVSQLSGLQPLEQVWRDGRKQEVANRLKAAAGILQEALAFDDFNSLKTGRLNLV